MSENAQIKKLPEVARFIRKIVIALRAMDGVAKSTAVRDAIVSDMIEKGEPLNEAILSTGDAKYQNDIRWARMYLVKAKLLEPVEKAGRGVWKLTQTGWVTPMDSATILKIHSRKSGASDDQRAPDEDDQQLDLPGLSSWESQLRKTLTTMPHEGFERLCAEIMTKNGLHSTKVTGKAGDKGIDGIGILPFDAAGLISMPVAWQCKRYASGKVSAGEVRNFRGSLDKGAAGIVFTTSTFTAEAEQAANQLGHQPIKLVDLEALVKLLRDLHLGVKQVTTHVVDAAFFEPFLKPVGASQFGGLPGI